MSVRIPGDELLAALARREPLLQMLSVEGTDSFRAFHGIADRRLRRREWAEAWRAHWQSVTGRGGWRFLPYTRKLVGLP